LKDESKMSMKVHGTLKVVFKHEGTVNALVVKILGEIEVVRREHISGEWVMLHFGSI
jgi:hydrogenase maturation factor